MASVGLCIITKHYDDSIKQIVESYSQYYDKVYVQVNGLGGHPKSTSSLDISEYTWNDDFAEARNALLKKVKTNYWMWLDSDDEILNPELIPELIEYAVKGSYDLIYLPYQGEVNEHGEVKTTYFRERLMRTAHPFYWKEPVHEALESDIPPKVIAVDRAVVIKHAHKPYKENSASAKRNLRILKKQYLAGDRRTFRLHYIASSYAVIQDYKNAIKFFEMVVKRDDMQDVVYDSWLNLGGLYIQTGDFERGYNAYKAAIGYKPDLPDAYLYLGSAYLGAKDFLNAIASYEQGFSKKLDYTFRPTDLNYLTNVALAQLAEAYSAVGEHTKSKKIYKDLAAK